MAARRKAAKLEGHRESLEQFANKIISPGILQKMFEEFTEKELSLLGRILNKNEFFAMNGFISKITCLNVSFKQCTI